MMDIFLIILALVWIFLASLQDLRKREVYNFLSFSLIAFALAYRAFYAVIYSDFMFLIYGLLGLGIFIILGYAFYYARVFAGGDAKLLMALGAVLPSSDFYSSLTAFLAFVFLLLLFGSLWGIVYSFILVSGSWRKFRQEFRKQWKKNRKLEYLSLGAAIVLLFLPVIMGDFLLLAFPAIILLLPVLYVYGKAIEESCMIISVNSSMITLGDWLYEPIRIRGKTIKPDWEGLSEKELEILKKYGGKIKIKQGIPFVPAFLFAFLALVYVIYSGFLMV